MSGTTSDVAGSSSANNSSITVNDSSTVTPTFILSPDSTGRKNPRIVKADIRTQGVKKFRM